MRLYMGRDRTTEPNVRRRWGAWLCWALDAYDVSQLRFVGWLQDEKQLHPEVPADLTTVREWLKGRRRISAPHAWHVGQMLGLRLQSNYLNGLTVLHGAGYFLPCARLLRAAILGADGATSLAAQVLSIMWWEAHGFLDGLGEPPLRSLLENELSEARRLSQRLDAILTAVPNAFRANITLDDLGRITEPLRLQPSTTSWAMLETTIARWDVVRAPGIPPSPLESLDEYVSRLERTAKFARRAFERLSAASNGDGSLTANRRTDNTAASRFRDQQALEAEHWAKHAPNAPFDKRGKLS